jgi:hypothetical protein
VMAACTEQPGGVPAVSPETRTLARAVLCAPADVAAARAAPRRRAATRRGIFGEVGIEGLE